MTQICPKCKGSKVIFDPISLLLTIALPIALLVEHGEKKGITKKQCHVCDGKGYLKFDNP